MNEEYNPITLNDLPTTNTILSSDQIIVFEEIENNLLPKIYKTSEISACAVTSENFEILKNKFNEVKKKIQDAIKYLNTEFITKTDASEKYATISDLNDKLMNIEKIISFKNRLVDKADSTCLEYYYNKVKEDCQYVKNRLGDESWVKDGNGDRGYGYKILLAKKAKQKES